PEPGLAFPDRRSRRHAGRHDADRPRRSRDIQAYRRHFLVAFPTALYFSAPMAFRFGGRIADTAVGFAGGILGGLAGLSGPLPILWASIRGWGKDQRRGVFQIFNWTVLATAFCLHVASGLVHWEVVRLALLAFPATVCGAWIGARFY